MSWASNELAASQRYKEHRAALARISKLETALRKIYNHGDEYVEPWSVEIARKALEE